MIVGLVEREMVVLVVDDRLAAITRCGAPVRDLEADAVRARLQGTIGAMDAVAVRQQEIGRRQDAGRRRAQREQAGADQQLALAALAGKLDQLVAALGGDDRVGEHALQVDLVADLDQHVGGGAFDQPVDGVGDGGLHGRLVLQGAALLAVEQAQDHHHAEPIAGHDHLFQPRRPGRFQHAVGGEAADPPGLMPRIALRAAALQVEADREQAVRAIGGQGSDELARVALGIPFAVGIGPGATGRRVLVVGDGVGHAAVEQQSFDAMALPAAPGIGRHAIDREAAVGDGHDSGHGEDSLLGARHSVALMGVVINKDAPRSGALPAMTIRSRRPRRRGGSRRRPDRARRRESAR